MVVWYILSRFGILHQKKSGNPESQSHSFHQAPTFHQKRFKLAKLQDYKITKLQNYKGFSKLRQRRFIITKLQRRFIITK
jgi:hypothetical protein